MNSFGITGKINADGYSIGVKGREYSVTYSREPWQRLKMKEALVDNILYGKTAQLRMIKDRLEYSTNEPFLKGFFDWGVERDIPKIADTKNIGTDKLISQFRKSQTVFASPEIKGSIFDGNATDENKALLGMSFGKDCFLTFGIAQEIGLDVTPVFFSDMVDYNPTELLMKKKIMEEFTSKFKKKVITVADNTDSVYYDPSIPDNCSSFDEINAMALFTLNLLPIAYSNSSRYVMFGNEHNHNDYYANRDGFRTFPSGDQASEYMERLNGKLRPLTAGNSRVVSLIEPIYNLAEMQLLGKRYPQFLPLIMSCLPKGDNKERWCSACPMCAKFYAFCLAVGIDVSKFGFRESMLQKKFWNLFPLFNEKPTRPYEKPKAQRDEQLLTFYLAYKNNAKGELIDLFKEKFLEEAKQKEEELRKKFFGINSSVSMPAKIKNAIVKIYKEELSDLG